MAKIKIGLLGVGHLGKIHLKCLLAIDQIELTGIFDTNLQVLHSVAQRNNVHQFSSYQQLLATSEAVVIATPTSTHFKLVQQAIQLRKHVFIEKPLTDTLETALTLIALQKEYGVKVQVGHVERFNPAFQAIQHISLQPLFIEAHRLAVFNPRGTDVSVVLDLMIHDLDLVLKIVQSPLQSLSASGVAVVSKQLDIANVRLEFQNGCVANLTASRISMKQMRKVRLFQKDAYLSLDLLEKKVEVVQLWNEADPNKPNASMTLDTSEGKKYIGIQAPEIKETNAIQMELTAFADSILNDTIPVVSIEEGYNCLALAHQIIEEIEKRSLSMNDSKILPK